MPVRRLKSLRRGSPLPGDKVKIVGGNVCLGSTGIYSDDGSVTTASGKVVKVDPQRLIIVELRPEIPLEIVEATTKLVEIPIKLKKDPPTLLVEQEARFIGEHVHVEFVIDKEESAMEKRSKERKKKADWGF